MVQKSISKRPSRIVRYDTWKVAGTFETKSKVMDLPLAAANIKRPDKQVNAHRHPTPNL